MSGLLDGVVEGVEEGVVLLGGAEGDAEAACQPRPVGEVAHEHAARKQRVPVLAICRGIQVLNVALGGTLVQDIGSQLPAALQHDTPSDGASGTRDTRTHDVIITPGSRLARALGATRIAVNSFHHQAVARTAKDLRETAHSPDGVIEGLETNSDWWVLAVQWHPEEMDQSEETWDRSLFKAFAEAVTNRA
jgi:putative glutamine amidotransferase